MRGKGPDLQLEATKVLWDWWFRRAAAGQLPCRVELDPVALRPVLTKLWLTEWSQDDQDFRYRLAGEEINEVYGYPLRGHLLGEILMPESANFVREKWHEILGGPCVGHIYGRIYKESVSVRMGERLVLPIANSAGQPAYILGVTTFDPSEYQRPKPLRPVEFVMPNREYRLYPVADLIPLEDHELKKARD